MSDTLQRMGRPSSGKPHRKPIQVKLDDEERAFCDARAHERGLETSTWMRTWCLTAPVLSPRPARATKPKPRKK